LDELRADCIDTSYDAKFVTETWFNDQFIINIIGYDCFKRDRNNKRGVGCASIQAALGLLVSGRLMISKSTRWTLNRSGAWLNWQKNLFFLGVFTDPK